MTTLSISINHAIAEPESTDVIVESALSPIGKELRVLVAAIVWYLAEEGQSERSQLLQQNKAEQKPVNFSPPLSPDEYLLERSEATIYRRKPSFFNTRKSFSAHPAVYSFSLWSEIILSALAKFVLMDFGNQSEMERPEDPQGTQSHLETVSLIRKMGKMQAEKSQTDFLSSINDTLNAFARKINRKALPQSIIPLLLGSILLCWFEESKHDPNADIFTEELELCYDSRTRALLRMLSIELTTYIQQDNQNEKLSLESIFKFSRFYIVEAERLVLSQIEGVLDDVQALDSQILKESAPNVFIRLQSNLFNWMLSSDSKKSAALSASLIGNSLASTFSNPAQSVKKLEAKEVVEVSHVSNVIFKMKQGGFIDFRPTLKESSGISKLHFESIDDLQFGNKHIMSETIVFSGWIESQDDFRLPWQELQLISPFTNMTGLVYDPSELQSFTEATNDFLGFDEIKRITMRMSDACIGYGYANSVIWPDDFLRLAGDMNETWAVVLEKSEAAGKILAEQVISKYICGKRSITLTGFGAGAVVITSCLRQLVAMTEAPDSNITGKCDNFGIIENVYIFGSPVPFESQELADIRSVVAGRFVNGYSAKDWMLALWQRNETRPIMGLGAIPSGLVENIDLSEIIVMHSSYKEMITEVMKRMFFE